MKRAYFVLVFLFTQFFCFAQQWAMDEAADDARESGSDIGSLILGGIILFGIFWIISSLSDIKEKSDKRKRENKFREDIENKKRKATKEEEEYLSLKSINGLNAVDLGLSVKWASFNLGAKELEDEGFRFAWGDIHPYDSEKSSPFKWEVKSKEDALSILENKTSISGNPKFDAATYMLGGAWRLPKKEEVRELIEVCKWQHIFHNGKLFYIVTGKNGNKIMLPFSKTYIDDKKQLVEAWSNGQYWIGDLEFYSTHKHLDRAWILTFGTAGQGQDIRKPSTECLIRPVHP